MAPIYEDGLLLFSWFIKHDLSPREAVITGAQRAIATASAEEWADFALTAFSVTGSLQSRLDTNAALVRVVAYLGDGTDTPEVGVIETNNVGTSALSTLPANCAVLVKKTTGFGGRANRGRFYFPWAASESGTDEMGKLNTSDRTFLQTGVTEFFDYLESVPANSYPVIPNRVYDQPWTDPNRQLLEVNIGRRITAMTVEPVIATQKRRMPR